MKRDVVYCKDLKGQVEYVIGERGTSNTHLKFGIDAGGVSLKVNLTIQSTDNELNLGGDKKRQKYSDGVSAKRFLDSGVKKLFVVGISESTQENYENVAQLWSAINTNQLERGWTLAVDLKIANILSGIMTHSCAFPCIWCFAKKGELHELGPYRTIGDILKYYNDWQSQGGIKKDAKDFKNCTNPPIFQNNPDQLVLDIVTPPELHLMLGVVNSVHNHMREQFFEEVSTWTKHCNVEREITRCGTGFNGNSCKTLLDHLHYLRSICSLGCLPFVRLLDDFRLVIHSCFGQVLDPDSANYIDNFKESYLHVGSSVTANR